jgi:DnaJ-class molecular chaperone
LSVTLREAFLGCTKDLKIQTSSFPIITKVNVRQGSRHNECIQTFESGDGEQIKIVLSIVSDYSLTKESGDLRIEVNVSALRMIIGGWTTIPTIDGEQVQVRIPAGLEPGKRLKVKDQGYWRDSSCKSRGDLIIKILPKIQELKDIPPSLLKEFKEAC